jgi:hypothetical protein
VIQSISGVCEVRLFAGARARANAPPDLLIEVPHGATRASHYHRLRAELRGDLPDGLIDFFLVNTDAGAPEYACALAERLVQEEPERAVLVLLSEIPRTFIDCNRVLDVSPEEYKAGKVTPGLPPYIRDPHDQELLRSKHAAWASLSEEAWRWCCDGTGLGLMAHTYAPRSVDVEVNDDIVAALRRAYRPETEPTWPLRPQIDLIARDPAGNVISAPLVEKLAGEFAAAGFETAVSGTYPLHPSTLAYHRALRYQPRTACIEVRRDLLADPFVPFAEQQIAPNKVARLVEPLSRAVRACWRRDIRA